MRRRTQEQGRSRAAVAARLGLLTGAVAVAVVAALGSGLASAQEPAGRGRPPAREDLVLKLAGKKIRVDAATGKLRTPTVEEAQQLVTALTEMTHRTVDESQIVQSRSGATALPVRGFMHVVVGRPNPDGTTSVRCVTSVEAATEFLAEEPPSGK